MAKKNEKGARDESRHRAAKRRHDAKMKDEQGAKRRYFIRIIVEFCILLTAIGLVSTFVQFNVDNSTFWGYFIATITVTGATAFLYLYFSDNVTKIKEMGERK